MLADGLAHYVAAWNLATGHPGLSVAGGTADGTPVGVQFVGNRHDKRMLVTLGDALLTALNA